MGLGDQLLATGMARGARARGKRIAFGDGRRIICDGNSEPIFRGNPNIAPPGSERDADLEWIGFYKGSRIYNSHDRVNNRWVWNYEFKARPGEIFLSEDEKERGRRAGAGFILIEPNIEAGKIGAENKGWGFERYQAVAGQLIAGGQTVVQFVYPKSTRVLRGVLAVGTRDFRDALAVLANARMYLGPEGGLHHGAAAVGIPAVVIFGSWVPPDVTGYDTHTNIARGKACGSLAPCAHCQEALASVSVNEVMQGAGQYL